MKTIVEMTREAGGFDATPEFLERFAALVRADERNRTWTQEDWTEYECSIAAAEREACAKVCDELHWPWHMGDNSGPKECAAAIRARGNT
jgi:hypothetical protein